MIMYLNVSINYLSNINCKFVMMFSYHDNLLKIMRIWNLKILVVEKKKKTITHYTKV